MNKLFGIIGQIINSLGSAITSGLKTMSKDQSVSCFDEINRPEENSEDTEKKEIQEQINSLEKEIAKLKAKLALADSDDEKSEIQSQLKDKQNELGCLEQSVGGQTPAGCRVGTDDFLNNMTQQFNNFISSMSPSGGTKETNGTTNPISGSNVTTFDINRDDFAKELDDTFASHEGSVLKGKGGDIYDIAVKNGVNPALFAAIICNETGYGTSKAIKNKNNPGGIMKSSGGLRSYGSVDEGLNSMAGLLKKSYIDKGRTTISSIGAVYCPGADNASWNKVVTELYNKFSS